MEVLQNREKESTFNQMYHAESIAQGLTELSAKIKQSIPMFMARGRGCALRMRS
jgi:hypothetical protein